MLDINLFREAKGANLDVVRQSQLKRFANPEVVDQIVELDKAWRQASFQGEQLGMQFNQLNKEIASLRKAGSDTSALQQQSKQIKAQLTQARQEEQDLQKQRDELLCSVGNIVDPSVPVSRDESENQLIMESSTPRRGASKEDQGSLLNHPELVKRLGIAELDAAAAVAGGRAYYLLNEGVLLNQALVSYGLHFLRQRGWSAVQTPYWLTADTMSKCAQLSQFDEELYQLVDDSAQPPQQPASPSSSGAVTGPPSSTSRYLIATSEQALCALHKDDWFEPTQLPVRYAGFSTCFRREAGSHGKDTLGIFRVHQFDKVEQFAITPPGSQSQELLKDMVRNAGDFYDSLGIPYRLMRVVSGALNASASCKIDLEGWFPASGAYRELVSASNCTDYQARRLNIRMRTSTSSKADAVSGGAHQGGTGNSVHVHMLNATLCATQRTLCCVLENHQTPDGIRVPAVLQPYMHGQDFIKFNQTIAAAGKALLKGARLAR